MAQMHYVGSHLTGEPQLLDVLKNYIFRGKDVVTYNPNNIYNSGDQIFKEVDGIPNIYVAKRETSGAFNIVDWDILGMNGLLVQEEEPPSNFPIGGVWLKIYK